MRFEDFQRSISVCDIGRRHSNRVRKSIRIYGDMSLNSRYFFARIVAFISCCIGVFYTLRIDN